MPSASAGHLPSTGALILGAIMARTDYGPDGVWTLQRLGVQSKWFATDLERQIYEEMCRRVRPSNPGPSGTDAVSIRDWCRSKGLAESDAYIYNAVSQRLVEVNHLSGLAESLLCEYRSREVAKASKLAANLTEQGRAEDGLRILKAATTCLTHCSRSSRAATLGELLAKDRDAIRAQDERPVVSTTIPVLDQMAAGGFLPGDVVIVTGLRGTGKTQFSLRLVSGAIKVGRVRYFQAEMASPKFLARLRARMVGTMLANRYRQVCKQDAQTLAARLELEDRRAFSNWEDRLRVDFTSKPTVEHIRSVVETDIQSGDRPKMIVIDHFGLVDAGTPDHTALNQAVLELRSLAKDTNAILVLLAQPSRPAEEKVDSGALSMTLAKGTSALEECADMFLWLVSKEHRTGVKDESLTVLKLRDGEPGAVIPMEYDLDHLEWQPLEPPVDVNRGSATPLGDP